MPRSKKLTIRPSRSKKATYRPVRVGIIKHRSASSAVKHLLKTTNWSQVKIAQKCKVTPACVCQLAAVCR